jgi:hypothetical protein
LQRILACFRLKEPQNTANLSFQNQNQQAKQTKFPTPQPSHPTPNQPKGSQTINPLPQPTPLQIPLLPHKTHKSKKAPIVQTRSQEIQRPIGSRRPRKKQRMQPLQMSADLVLELWRRKPRKGARLVRELQMRKRMGRRRRVMERGRGRSGLRVVG